MAKEFSKSFYSSTVWQKARHAYIMKRIGIDGGMCERCHKAPGYIVHHCTHLNEQNINDMSVTVDAANLEYVCKECHDAIHEEEFRGRAPKERRYVFDEHGNVVPMKNQTPPHKIKFRPDSHDRMADCDSNARRTDEGV